MITKAVITAAGKGSRQYPATHAVQKELFPLIDLDGIAKPTIQIIAEQAVKAGIEEICIVVNPGEAEQFQRHFKGLTGKEKEIFRKKNKDWILEQSDRLADLNRRITYIEQPEPHGFGHAVWCARLFTEPDPFLLLLGDHLYLSDSPVSCIEQAIQGFEQVKTTLLPVARTPVNQITLFGTLSGDPIPDKSDFYKVLRILEKPDADRARKQLRTPGLSENEYLTLFGMYVLSDRVMHHLGRHVENDVRSSGEIQLTTALQELIEWEGAYAMEIKGQRLDMGTPLGYIQTQLALAKRGVFGKRLE
jgi:UTP--glucose-1-phosphate uridylyltransferase